MATITHYTVTNRITGKTSTYKTGTAASRAAERMNMAYGSHIAGRQAHWSDEVAAWTPCAGLGATLLDDVSEYVEAVRESIAEARRHTAVMAGHRVALRAAQSCHLASITSSKVTAA